MLNLILHHCEVNNINTKISSKVSCKTFYRTHGKLSVLRRLAHSNPNFPFERWCMDDRMRANAQAGAPAASANRGTLPTNLLTS